MFNHPVQTFYTGGIFGMNLIVLNIDFDMFQCTFFATCLQKEHRGHSRPKRPHQKIVRTRASSIANLS
jgi:hypothetical protein